MDQKDIQMSEELAAMMDAGGDYPKVLEELAKKYNTHEEYVEDAYEQYLEDGGY